VSPRAFVFANSVLIVGFALGGLLAVQSARSTKHFK
jgi:hypothetical protein